MKTATMCRFGRRKVLGETRPGLPAVVYLDRAPHTEVSSHEEVHVALNSGSIHGVYLMVVASFAGHAREGLPPTRRKEFERKFESLFSTCRLVQEGCATAVELTYLLNRQGKEAVDEMRRRLPRFYKDALAEFSPFAVTVLDSLGNIADSSASETLNLVFHGMARACLDTLLFEKMGSSKAFWGRDLESFLGDSANVPDKRLGLLAKHVRRHTEFGAGVVRKLEVAGVVRGMEELAKLARAGGNHSESVRRRFELSKLVNRECSEIVGSLGLFPVDDSIVRRIDEFFEREARFSRELSESMGVPHEPNMFEMAPEDFISPIVRMYRGTSRPSKKTERVSGAAFVARSQEYGLTSDGVGLKRAIVHFWPREKRNDLECELVQLVIEERAGERTRIRDGRDDEALVSLVGSMTGEEFAGLTQSLSKSSCIAVTLDLIWRALDPGLREQLTRDAGIPICLYDWVVTPRKVAGWVRDGGPAAGVTVVQTNATSVEGDEPHDGALVAVRPFAGGSVVRFGLVTSEYAELVLGEVNKLASDGADAALSKSHLELAYWVAVKVFASEELHEDRLFYGTLEGGKARAASLSPRERAQIARRAARSRWKKQQ